MSVSRPTPASGRRWHRLLLLFMLACALYLRLEGIEWPAYHPDEPVIAGWLRQGEPDRTYPGGFFSLARPIRWSWEVVQRARHRLAVFTGAATDPLPPPPNYLLMARYINVWLAVLTCLLIYGTARALSGSRAYALVSATLMAFSQYHVEHSHYAETDIAMIFALAVSLAAWLQHVRTERARWFFAAAFAMGFAGGTKFTLVAFWPAVVIFPIIGKTPPSFSNVWKWRLAGLAAAVFLLAAGFVAATPAITDWREFWAGAAAEAARVYRETRLNMGPLADDTAVRFSARWHDLVSWSQSLGLPWLVLWAVSLPMLFAPGTRKAWVPLALSPFLFLIYWVFKSPWVRTQEFMVFLPFAALTAPWALLHAWRRGGRITQTIVVLACAAACFGAAIRGARTASIFGWTDTRDSATRWLALCAPADAAYAKEKYADATPPAGSAISLRMVAHHEADELRRRSINFILRNGAEGDRGMVHPVTGKRFEEFDRRYTQFLHATEKLRVFAPMPPPDTLTTFNSIRMELYGLPRYAQWPTVTHPLPRPAFITRRERWTYFPVGRQLGPDTVLELTPDGITCAIGGPDDVTSPVYAIVYTRERPAVISLKGFGHHRLVRLAPYDARVVPLVRPVWKPRWSHFERITARIIPQRNVYRVPCYMQVAFSRAETRRILHDLGILTTPDFGLAADPAISRARITRIEKLLRAATTNFGAGPNSAFYYDRFARLRVTNDVAVEWDESSIQPAAGNARARIAFPIMLAPAPCTLSFDLAVGAVGDRGRSPDRVPVVFFDVFSGERLLETELTTTATNSIVLSLCATRTTPLVLMAAMPEAVSLAVPRAELTWDVHSVLHHEAVLLRLALARQLVRQDQRQDALEILSALPDTLWPQAERERRRLAWAALSDRNDEEAFAAARRLLEVAPNHIGALGIAAAHDLKAAATLQSIESVPRMPVPLRFQRFIALHGTVADPTQGVVHLLLELTEDDPPPLIVRTYVRRHRRWKAVETPGSTAPISIRAAGERSVVTVALPAANDLARTAVAIEPAVRWHAGRLSAVGFEDGFIPLDCVARP